MSTAAIIQSLPLWAVFPVTVLLLATFFEMAFYLARRRRAPHQSASGQSSAVVGGLLSLLAFSLGITFGMASDRFSARKQLVIDEANAIGTAWLRAKALPAPYDTQVPPMLEQYLATRVGVAEDPSPARLEELQHTSTELHRRLWVKTSAASREHPQSITVGLFMSALNKVIDLHTERSTIALQRRIPRPIWSALYFVSVVAVFILGYSAGQSGRRSLVGTVGLLLALATMFRLIAAIDRPTQTVLQINQAPFLELQQTINSQEPNHAD
jgi:hypothetical protein